MILLVQTSLLLLIFLSYDISDVADSFIKISSGLVQLATTDHRDIEKFLTKVAETFEKARVIIFSCLISLFNLYWQVLVKKIYSADMGECGMFLIQFMF